MIQLTTKDEKNNTSNNKNYEQKVDPSFHTTLRKIKKYKESI